MRSRISLTLAFLLFGLLVGCTSVTPAQRSKQEKETFSKLDKETQDRLLDGYVQAGDSMVMVYIAFGTPYKKETDIQLPLDRDGAKLGPEKKYTLWTYYDFDTERTRARPSKSQAPLAKVSEAVTEVWFIDGAVAFLRAGRLK